MIKIAFFDHSYHKHTKSTEFFVSLLIKHGQVTFFYDDTWRNNQQTNWPEFNEFDYDLIVIMQVHNIFDILSGRHPNVVFIPMYDAMVDGGVFFWREAFNQAKVISFSWKLHQEVISRGGISKYVKYYPNPDNVDQILDYSTPLPFFWYRKPPITIELVLKLHPHHSRLWVHNAPDPGAPELAEKISGHKFRAMSQWFDNSNDYTDALNSSNIYFAPRVYEGIGQSFIEAMAMGMCVVAPDTPTMNEYISDGTTGLLYHPDNLIISNFSDFQQIGERARESVVRGYSRWLMCEDHLTKYVLSSFDKIKNDRSNYNFLTRISFADLIENDDQPKQDLPKISIVTVCVNSVAVIEETIKSVLSQVYGNIEYIIIDGGSTDGTTEIIKSYSEKISYWVSEKDSGVYFAMNKSIDLCSGEFILFMNAGDLFSGPNSLSRALKMIPQNIDVIYGHHIYLRQGIEEYHAATDFTLTCNRLKSGDVLHGFLTGIPCHQSTLVRKSILSELRFDTSYRICADLEFLFRAWVNGAKFYNSDEIISIYSDGGISSTNSQKMNAELILIVKKFGSVRTAEKLSAVINRSHKNFTTPSLKRWMYIRYAELLLSICHPLKSAFKRRPYILETLQWISEYAENIWNNYRN